MTILKKWISPVVIGFIVAGIIIAILEWMSSFISPLPGTSAAMNAPWTAYILVFLSWAAGAFAGGCTATWFVGEKQMGAITVLAALLVIGGVAYMTIFGFASIPTVLGILILAGFPFLGRLTLITFEEKKRAGSMVNTQPL